MAENRFQKRNSTEKTDKEFPKLAPLVREISWSRPATSKILYLAFNKSVKLEAAKKFADKFYVAVTRTKNSIHIPETLMPSEFPKSSQIHVVKVVSEEEKEQQRKAIVTQKAEKTESKTEKAYSVEEVRTKHKDAYKPWTTELDNELTVMFCEGVNTKDIAKHFGRTRGAITSRIKKLELEELYG